MATGHFRGIVIPALSYEYLAYGRATDVPPSSGRRFYKLLELQPGVFAWGTLIVVALASYWIPTGASIFIIGFDAYWLIKTIFLSVHMNHSFRRMRANLRRDWMAEVTALPPATGALQGVTHRDLYHLVVLPMATEPHEVVRESFQALLKTTWPLDRLIVVLATERRVGEQARDIARRIGDEFGHRFFRFLSTEHPDDIPGEIRGKGSNETWAGRKALSLIDELGIPHRNVVVSVFDVDTVTPPDFFACLSWHYLTTPQPLRSSFQPIPVFNNNIWHAPAFARVFAFSTTFWQLIQQARPEQLVTFSSQSIGLLALVDVDFWQTNVVSEDSQIFWKCLLRYDGDWRTVPMYFPVYMDANVAPTFWGTVANQYRQIRRWHYGVENNPYFLFGFSRNPRIPFRTKLRHALQMVEKTHSSSTNALIIFLLGWLPITIGRGNFGQTVLAYNLPHITQNIMLAAMVGLITSAAISILLLPPRPPAYGAFRYIWMVLQWLLFPVNFILFGAIPALDAQTRLLFGKYMGFWVTPKSRPLL
ncbi:MAG TPA: glycosyltransferase family 2 protein [Candidatus Paceibacterota bacterium]|nr:glycosyltransferase family 2 protein [Candidatus Paceibacterota bacterium]